MTDQEAYEEWKAQPLNRLSVSPEQTWNAALAWLRSQGEPVAWRVVTREGATRCILEREPLREQFDLGETFVPLFLAPQPAIPEGIKTAIDELLTHVMDIAVKNGADSRSMPDEYVMVAAWLCSIEPQPAGPDQQGEVK